MRGRQRKRSRTSRHERAVALSGASSPVQGGDRVAAARLDIKAMSRVTGWWEEAFSLKPTASEMAGHKCGEKQMITVVAYDISDPKRLVKVARLCEDYGVRVQYSVFECRLEADRFSDFWLELEELIDAETDRITAYKVCAQCAKEIYSAGTQTHMEEVVAYVF